MAKEELMEEMDNEGTLITLEDEEGNEVEFEFLDVVEYEGEEYIVLIDTSIDDDELLDKLFEIFKEKYEGDIDFA